MWPGQQPPGGEQNPQDQNQSQNPQQGQAPNPYQQQGSAPTPGPQPGPYQQQPGPYGQPGPYQQPGPYGQQQSGPYGRQPGQSWNTAPAPLGPPVPPDRGERAKTRLIAIVAASAVVVTAAVTGVVVLGGDDGDDAKPQAASSPSASKTPKPSATANPRDGSSEEKPQVEGWKTVVSTKWGTAFDVPADWELASPESFYFFEDEAKDDGSAMIGWTGPAMLKSEWCSIDSDGDGSKENHELAAAGSKGAEGAKDLDDVAYQSAGTWVLAAYTQPDKKKVKITKPQPFTSTSGLKGSVATAKSTGVKKENRCDTEGKAVSFGFENGNGNYVSWSLFGAAGVKEEFSDATAQQILKTVRLTKAKPTES